jgi:hypothetical protein
VPASNDRCSDCDEPIVHYPPTVIPWTDRWSPDDDPDAEWSHLNGEPLCSVTRRTRRDSTDGT